MERMPYGWRGKIGLIYIASAYAMETEFQKMSPEGVTTHTTRVALSDHPDYFSIDDLTNLDADVMEATKLLAQAPLKSIAYGCTSGSFVNGLDYDKQLIKRMEQIAKIPCTTTATAVLAAAEGLQVQNIAIATPYASDVNERAYEYFTSGGLTITNMTGLSMMNDYKISELNLQTIYNMATKTITNDSEAIFISCTGLSTLPLINALEKDLNVPVITSNQATFWHALKLAHIQSGQMQLGTLFNL
ncbi:MAG TPA: aspartate/glutamate racemase family protein [Bacillota bacterium]|nr:aspartate/glutamate racemase family protein [Bacillota bacterium]